MDVPIAICFFGIVKMHKAIFASIENKILRVLRDKGLNYHIFLHTYNLEKITNKRNGEVAAPLDVSAWKKLHPDYWAVTDQSEFDNTITLSNYLKMGDPWPGSDGASLMNHLRALNSQNTVIRLLGCSPKNYRCVIFLRPDLIYIDPLDMNAVRHVLTAGSKQSVVYTPSWGKHEGGYNDRIALGTPRGMALYGNRLKGTKKYAEKKPLHSETYLKHVLDSNDVKHRSLEMRAARVRANGWIADFRHVFYGNRKPRSRSRGFSVPDRWTSRLTQKPNKSWSSSQFKNMNVSKWRKEDISNTLKNKVCLYTHVDRRCLALS